MLPPFFVPKRREIVAFVTTGIVLAHMLLLGRDDTAIAYRDRADSLKWGEMTQACPLPGYNNTVKISPQVFWDYHTTNSRDSQDLRKNLHKLVEIETGRLKHAQRKRRPNKNVVSKYKANIALFNCWLSQLDKR